MSQTLKSTPRHDGFRMPAEFEPHEGIWLLWPERPDNWRDGAKPAQKVFAQVAAAIAEGERVTVGVSDAQYDNARTMLRDNVRVVEISNNDSWMRDCGPTFVVNDEGEVRGVDWDFNAWGGLEGGLYFPWDKDERVARKVLAIAGVDRYKVPMVLEGGSIHVDGEGTLLVTEQCLLNHNRNPHLSKDQIEENLRNYLDVDKIIWLGHGIYMDETDGHVDDLACFVRPGVVTIHWTDDVNDPQYEYSLDCYRRLSEATDARGRKLEIHKITQPDPFFLSEEEAAGVDAIAGTYPRQAGERMAASYINYFIGNTVILVPEFGDTVHDQAAQDTLAELFPDRRVVAIPGREILLGGGNVHCITQQQPRGVRVAHTEEAA